MKKIILLGIASFLAMGLYSNPNPSPEVHLNEFMFTGANNWKIELYFYYCNLINFDSITLQSNSGTATVINFQFDQFLYFTDQDLSQPLAINPEGDAISITAHSYWLGNISCGFSFGNVPNPDVVKPLSGQSIERFEHTNCWYPYYPSLDVFAISNHPTMGLPNDTTGACGTLLGMVTDTAGNPVPDNVFSLDFPFTTDAAGHFSTRIFSRIYSWDTICYQETQNIFLPGSITPLSYTMVPDSAITRDIHLLHPLLVGISPQPKNAGSALNVFPNPVTDAITVSYTSDLAAGSDDLHLEIYDMNGNEILKKDLANHLGVLRMPIDLENGIYNAVLSGEGKIIGSARFVVNKAE